MNINDLILTQVFYEALSEVNDVIWVDQSHKTRLFVLNELSQKIFGEIRVQIKNQIFYHLDEHEYQ